MNEPESSCASKVRNTTVMSNTSTFVNMNDREPDINETTVLRKERSPMVRTLCRSKDSTCRDG